MIAMVLGDWPENGKYCLTYSRAGYQCLCYSYLVNRDNLNRIDLISEEIIPRIQQNMQAVINTDLAKVYSIHEQNNAFWDLLYVF